MIARIESDQRNGLIFTGAIWAWLAVNADKLGSNFAKEIVFLPAAIMVFFFYRYLGRYKKFLALQNTRGNWKSFSEYRLDTVGRLVR